jgi:hypothetical protein
MPKLGGAVAGPNTDTRRLTGPSVRAHAGARAGDGNRGPRRALDAELEPQGVDLRSTVLILRAIIGNYAAGSIRVVIAIRFQALITVIAHTS